MKTLVLSATAFFFFSFANAQNGIIKAIGGAAKNKVEQQDFNSTRTNKEKLNEEDRPKTAPAPAPSAPGSGAAAPESEAAPGNYNETYTFDQKFTYEMEDLAKHKGEKMLTTYYYSEAGIMTQLQDNPMSMIFDTEHETMIMLDEKAKTAMVMPSRFGSAMAAKQNEATSKATVTKTGNTKKILGYTCEEYLIQDEKYKSNVWITTEIKLDYTKLSKAIGGQKGTASGSSEFDGQGMMMEMTSYNKKGEAETHMIMTEYKEETTTKSLSEYKVTAL